MSRQVARKFSDHVLAALEEATRTVGRNMTVESETTPPSDELRALWNQQKEISERLTGKASLISTKELHRAVLLVMADRLHYTIKRDTDLMYHNCDDFLADLRVVQRSLAEAGDKRAAYGPLQDLIWQTETSASTWSKWSSASIRWCMRAPRRHSRARPAWRTRTVAADDA